MNQAIMFDQGVVRGDVADMENADVVYADNAKTEPVSETTDFQEAEVVEEPTPPAQNPDADAKTNNEEEAEF